MSECENCADLETTLDQIIEQVRAIRSILSEVNDMVKEQARLDGIHRGRTPLR